MIIKYHNFYNMIICIIFIKIAKYLGTKEKPVEKDNIIIYYEEICKIPLLTIKQEKDCIRRASKGDQKAKDMLVKANLRYVVSVAKRYKIQGFHLGDIIGEGNMGLMEAIERFDPEKGNRVTTYAKRWIERFILKAIYEKSRFIRIPLHRIGELNKILKEMNYLEREGKGQNLESVANNLNMPIKRVAKTLEMNLNPLSFNAPIKHVDKDCFIEDLVYDKSIYVEEEAFYKTLKKDLNSVMKILTVREVDILKKRFGLNGRPMTLQEVGDEYKFTKERIRQIQEDALKKLRQSKESQRLREYLEE